MAWKRGTQNNSAGEIRKGHIREFLVSSSKQRGVVGQLKILAMENTQFIKDFGEGYFALICSETNGLPSQFSPYVDKNVIHLHSHDHPRCVLSALINDQVPRGCIVLNEIQCLNSKVCVGELEDWTVYQGESFTYDGREGAIGDTEVRYVDRPVPSLQTMAMWVRPRYPNASDCAPVTRLNGTTLAQHIQRSLYGAIVSADEVFQVTLEGVAVVCRVGDMEAAGEEEQEEETDICMPDCHRGVVDVDTSVYLWVEGTPPNFELHDNPIRSTNRVIANVVTVLSSDDELFPVKRRLLRPCISLTSIVQAGRGKYKDDETKDRPDEWDVRVPVDACTFDRVLLYLEHEARGEQFKFDPLIAPELLEAAQSLQVRGLQEACERVLGSFEERVRRTPIPLQEVIDRNEQGRLMAEDPSRRGKRGDTLLIMSGMVLDITRWLDEHPGGSTIIPEQALNMDCTAFFEIYHASRQSFLYLKEFYIGELSEVDKEKVPLPPGGAVPSPAFLEQLNRVTPWRLKQEDLQNYVVHKSF